MERDMTQNSMEFRGIFHEIPWNSGVAKWNITNSMEFHRIMRSKNQNITEFYGIPYYFDWHHDPLEFCVSFHGIPWNKKGAIWNDPWAQRIPWNYDNVTLINIGLTVVMISSIHTIDDTIFAGNYAIFIWYLRISKSDSWLVPSKRNTIV